MNLTNLQMKLRPSFPILLSTGLIITLSIASIIAHSQLQPTPSKNVGDDAPLLRTKNWIKGTPVTTLEKGKIYVVEFWATWCAPCKAEMPQLSEIARKFRDQVTVIGLDIYETPKTTISKIKSFVDSMGLQMDYNVAVADSYYMKKNWLDATGEVHGGIPRAFIVDKEGNIAWMGHPCDHFEDALSQIVNGSWDVSKLREKRNLDIRLKNMEGPLRDALEFGPDGNYRTDRWKRDSAFLLVDEFAKTEPLIKYTPGIASRLFSILLKNDLKKAYEFGKEALANITYESTAFLIFGAIENLPRAFNVTPEIYQLGIDALQMYINETNSCYPELTKLYKQYYRMAEWYWAIGNKQKAIEAQEKAVEDLKSKSYRTDDFPINQSTYEAWLDEYKKGTPKEASKEVPVEAPKKAF